VELRRQIGILRRWMPLLVLAAVMSGLTGLAVSSMQPKTYEAKATLIVGQSLSTLNPDYSALLVSQRLSTTYATIATTRPILQVVIDSLGLDETPDGLLRRVEADAPLDSTLLTIAARDPDAERAAAIANFIAAQLIDESGAVEGRQAELQAALDADLAATRREIIRAETEAAQLLAIGERTDTQEARLRAVEDRLPALRSTYATLLSYAPTSTANLLSVVEPASAPTDAIAPQVLLSGLLAAVLGLLVAAGLVAVREYLDDAVKSEDDLADIVDLPVLGSIAVIPGRDLDARAHLATLLRPRSAAAETYRTLRTNVDFAAVDRTVHNLLITSAVPREGKTVTAANLAIAFAQAGRLVILVDADLRRPSVHRAFGLTNTWGLTTLLRGEAHGADSVAQRTEQGNLRVITTGPLPPNPAELLGSQRMRAAVDEIAAGAELVIYDSPPLEAVADAAILAAVVDGVVLVVEAGRTRRRAVRMGHNALRRVGASILGTVLNRASQSSQHAYASYYESALPDIAEASSAPADRPARDSPRPSPS